MHFLYDFHNNNSTRCGMAELLDSRHTSEAVVISKLSFFLSILLLLDQASYRTVHMHTLPRFVGILVYNVLG